MFDLLSRFWLFLESHFSDFQSNLCFRSRIGLKWRSSRFCQAMSTTTCIGQHRMSLNLIAGKFVLSEYRIFQIWILHMSQSDFDFNSIILLFDFEYLIRHFLGPIRSDFEDYLLTQPVRNLVLAAAFRRLKFPHFGQLPQNTNFRRVPARGRFR